MSVVDPIKLTQDEIGQLRDLTSDDRWKVVEKILAKMLEDARDGCEISDDPKQHQGYARAIRDVKNRIFKLLQPPQEMAAEQIAYEHLRRSKGRDAHGVY